MGLGFNKATRFQHFDNIHGNFSFQEKSVLSFKC